MSIKHMYRSTPSNGHVRGNPGISGPRFSRRNIRAKSMAHGRNEAVKNILQRTQEKQEETPKFEVVIKDSSKRGNGQDQIKMELINQQCWNNIPVIMAQDLNEEDQVSSDDNNDRYVDYAGSGEDEDHDSVPRNNNNKINNIKNRKNVELTKKENRFIDTLLHAMECRSCNEVSCKKMKMILGHFLSCRGSQDCAICRQLIGIAVEHSENCTKSINEQCLVPMCDGLRAKQESIPNI